jgi:hypothetical protein
MMPRRGDDDLRLTCPALPFPPSSSAALRDAAHLADFLSPLRHAGRIAPQRGPRPGCAKGDPAEERYLGSRDGRSAENIQYQRDLGGSSEQYA